MDARDYDVTLMTALGQRKGKLHLKMLAADFSGVLCLMNAENPVSGSVTTEEACRLTGCIRTKMGIYPFEGTGTLTPACIEAELRCKGESMMLRGNRNQQEEE